MTSPEETPRVPTDEQIGLRQLTIAALSDDCAEFAERDEDFRAMKMVHFSVGYKRFMHNLMETEIDFTATHTVDEGLYDGVIYTLSLRTAQRIDYYTNDLIKLAEEQAVELPKTADICHVRFAHVADFTINQAMSLESNIHAYYEVHSHIDSEEIVDIEPDVSGDTVEEDEEPEEGHRRPLVLPTMIVHHQSEEAEGMDPDNKIPNTDDRLFADIVTDMYLRQAYDIFNAINSGNKQKIDLSGIFPPEFIKTAGIFPTE